MGLNRALLKFAYQQHCKQALVPSDAAAQAGGMAPPGAGPGGPPPDPSMGGGPGGPPMDPAQAGGPGGPPPDPSMGGGPGGPPPDPSAMGGQQDLGATIQTAMTNVLNQAGLIGRAGGGAGGKGQPKVDINTIGTDVFQLKKLLLGVLNHLNLPLPHDLLDGPNRDPQTGMPSANPQGDLPAGHHPHHAHHSAIQPMEPMQGAFPPPQGDPGAGKAAQVGREFPRMSKVSSSARALSHLIQSRRRLYQESHAG